MSGPGRIGTAEHTMEDEFIHAIDIDREQVLRVIEPLRVENGTA